MVGESNGGPGGPAGERQFPLPEGYDAAGEAKRLLRSIRAGALATLRESAPGVAIPAPVATAVTHWTTDPLAGGSYVFLPVGATRDDIEALAAPAGPVRFAGEATWWLHYGTVHGAVLSGIREARRIAGAPVTPGFRDH